MSWWELEGPFSLHKHATTDDFFRSLAGNLAHRASAGPARSRSIPTAKLFVVPKGVEHRPVARGEVHILLIEPTGTPNTGDGGTARTAHPSRERARA